MDIASIFGPIFAVPPPPTPTGALTIGDPLKESVQVAQKPDSKETQSNKKLYIGLAVALLVLILMLGGGYFMSSTKNGAARGDVK
jgi:hypothetical protein